MHLINQEHLFTLNQTKEFVEDYWIFEANRLNRFIERNIEFAEFYKRDCTEYNLQNFLSANYDLGNFMVSKPYDFNNSFIKAHEHFIACFQAHKMYNEYVKEKLKNYIEA